jgi:hypothetical protein
MKECPSCKRVKPLEEFRDAKLISGFGRICLDCKGKSEINDAGGKHSQRVRKIEKPKVSADLTNKKCPRCGSTMFLRTNRSSGSKFYGCSRFPRCKGTRSY